MNLRFNSVRIFVQVLALFKDLQENEGVGAFNESGVMDCGKNLVFV